MAEPKTRDVAKTAEGLQHVNTLAPEEPVYAGFYVHVIRVESDSAHFVPVYEASLERGGAVPTDHYTFSPQSRHPRNPRHEPAEFWPIVHQRGVPMRIRTIIRFWPQQARDEEVTVHLTIAELADTQKMEHVETTAKAGVRSEVFLCNVVAPLPPNVRVSSLTMTVSAFTAGGIDLGSVTIDGFELMAVVARPIATRGTDHPSKLDAGITTRRVRESIKAVGPHIDPAKDLSVPLNMHWLVHNLAHHAHPASLTRKDTLGKYDYPLFMNGIGGAWCILYNLKQAGECQAIVRLACAMMWQVGISEGFKRMNVWAEPDPTAKGRVVFLESEGDVGGLSEYPRKREPDDPNEGPDGCMLGLLTFKHTSGVEYSEEMSPPNRYEACIRVDWDGRVAYYKGGQLGGVPTKEDVITSTFSELVYYRWTDVSLGPRRRKYKVVALVHRFGKVDP